MSKFSIKNAVLYKDMTLDMKKGKIFALIHCIHRSADISAAVIFCECFSLAVKPSRAQDLNDTFLPVRQVYGLKNWHR